MKTPLVLFSLSLLLLSSSWAALAGQPEPPPSRRDPADARRERVQRLRELGGQLLESLAPLAEDLAGTAESLDAARLNDAIVSLLEPVLEHDRALEYLRIGFDPEETDFVQDTVKVFAEAGLRHSAWSPDPSYVELDLLARVERPAGGEAKAVVDGIVVLETDVIPLANFVVAQLAQPLFPRARSDESSAGQGGAEEGSAGRFPIGAARADEVFRAKLGDKLASTGPIRTMDELADLIVYLAGLRLTSITEDIERLKVALDEAPSEEAHAAVLASLADARRERDLLFNVRPKVVRDQHGRASAIEVAMTNSQVAGVQVRADVSPPRIIEHAPAKPEVTGGRGIERFHLAMTEGRIELSVQTSLDQGVQAYLLFKPLIVSTLRRIQEGDPGAVGVGNDLVRGWVSRARRTLVGDDE